MPPSIKPEERKPEDSGNKIAPQQAVQQNDSKKVGKPEDQEEDKPAPAVETKKTEETEFNVGNVCLL